jgi:hypothetical protein
MSKSPALKFAKLIDRNLIDEVDEEATAAAKARIAAEWEEDARLGRMMYRPMDSGERTRTLWKGEPVIRGMKPEDARTLAREIRRDHERSQAYIKTMSKLEAVVGYEDGGRW